MIMFTCGAHVAYEARRLNPEAMQVGSTLKRAHVAATPVLKGCFDLQIVTWAQLIDPAGFVPATDRL